MGKMWCVYHFLHAHTPHQHIPVLVVTDVPDGESVTVGLLERAGFQFGDFGVPWANYHIVQVDPKTSPADLVGRIRRGEGRRISYKELVERASRPL